ncbi:MAG: hypothetical protein ABUL60_11910 [Myxococcales bacterium]
MAEAPFVVSPPPPPRPAPVEPGPAPIGAAGSTAAAPPSEAVAASSAVPPVTPPAAVADAPRARVVVLLEPPYSALGHPRLGTEMATLALDEELFQWALGGSSDPAHPSNRPGYHPATRVVIDVQLLSRAPKGSTARLLRVARSTGYWPLRACFEAAQRLAVKSERSAKVRLTLSANGKVLGARSLGPMPEREYARCVLERVRGLDFTPGFTRKLDIEVSLKQWPGHAPVPPRAPDGPAVHLSKEAMASLEGLTPALSACYEKGLAGDANLWGRLAFKVELTPDGAVQQATAVETHFPDATVTECARQALLGARLISPGTSALTFAVRLGQPAPPTPPELSPAVPGPAPPADSPPAPPLAPEH